MSNRTTSRQTAQGNSSSQGNCPCTLDRAEPRDGESLSDFVNRFRPQGLPKVSGSPRNSSVESGTWCWFVDGWVVSYSGNADDKLMVYWQREDTEYTYQLDRDGGRSFGGGDWAMAEVV